MQMAQMAPQIYDLPQLHRSMLDVLGIKNAEKLVPLPDDQKPTDPVSENQAALKGKPLKAFQYQDHQAHMAVHQSMLQDPMIAAVIGQNPQAQTIMAALQAHIAEHVGFMYRLQVQQQLGLPLPEEDEKVSPEAEKAMSAMMAQAANQVLQQAQAAAAQQQAMQQAQDPVIQMQQQELQLKQQELQLKKAKAASESAVAMAKVQLETEKVGGNLKLNSMKVGADIRAKQHQVASQEQQAGLKTGLDIAKHKAEMDLQKRQAMLDHIQQFKRDEKPKENPEQ